MSSNRNETGHKSVFFNRLLLPLTCLSTSIEFTMKLEFFVDHDRILLL